jgi:transcriptional regulator with XRE-family HTH domain
MYATTPSASHPALPHQYSNGFVDGATIAIIGSTLAVGGTGSVFDLSRASEWRKMLGARLPDVQTTDAGDARPDIRSAAEHLANIRQVLNPAIADLAMVFGVSRQAIYKWIGGESTPEDDKLERIRSLSLAADAFHKAGVNRAPSLLKMKAFEGRSLLDLVAAGLLQTEHTQSLIAEAHAMEAAYNRSGLARSKAAPSDDWRAELSIPGSSE